SGTTSHSATIFTPSTPSSSVSTERPLSPVPTMPTRTTSCFSKGTARIDLRFAGAGGARSGCEPAVTCSAIALVKGPAVAIPAVASAAALSRSRRERSDISCLGCGRGRKYGRVRSARRALLLQPVAAAVPLSSRDRKEPPAHAHYHRTDRDVVHRRRHARPDRLGRAPALARHPARARA